MPKVKWMTMLGLPLAALSFSHAIAGGETDYSAAIEAGGQTLSADQIVEFFVGKTGHFHDGDSEGQMLISYGDDNVLAAKEVGGDGTRVGLFAVTDRGNICIGWENRDLPRLRCMDVLLVDGVVHKYNSDGSLSGSYPEFEEGKSF
jgi:hypothetical protein